MITAPVDLLSVSAADFKEAMSRVAGAVHVVTTAGPAGLGGATATAVSSLTDTPPMLLVCLRDESETLARIRVNGVFAVSTLAAEQQEVADIFAGRGPHSGSARFRASHGWRMEEGPPVLAGALAAFSCHVVELKTVGRSVLVIGAVAMAQPGEPLPPLLYHRRDYLMPKGG